MQRTRPKYLKPILTYLYLSIAYFSFAQTPELSNSNSFFKSNLFFISLGIGLCLLVFLIFIFKIIVKLQQKKREEKITEAIDLVKKSIAPPPVENPEILNSTIDLDKDPIPLEDEWMESLKIKAQLLIEDKKFSIVELASTMNLSERQFRRKLKQKTGMLPVAFMREIRLQKAKQLLSSGTFPTVALVCYEVGFSTPKHFSKLFQERFGKNPSYFLPNKSDTKDS